MNSGPLSDWIEVGIPNLGIISDRRSEATVDACLLEVGNASTHPEKVSTKTKRYLVRLTGGMLVKSTCQSAAGVCPRAWCAGKGLGFKGVLGLVRWHMEHDEERVCIEALSAGDKGKKVWRKYVSAWGLEWNKS